jgi:23S rRNA (adenine2503-C2)-methyltransferase
MLGQAVTVPNRQLVELDTHLPKMGSRRALFGLDADSLAKVMASMDEPAWRGRQLAQAIYRQWLVDLDEVSTLSASLRRRLKEEGWSIGRPAIAQTFISRDGTERYLIEGVAGPETVETVWMPKGDNGEQGDGSEDGEKAWDRATICVSSQVGCAVNCQFCFTARLGLQRSLTSGEIAGQVITLLSRHGVAVGKDRVNLVFMGMGEPFLNYDSWWGAVKLLVQEVGLSPQRMTVSTSGIVPAIRRFALESPALRPKLAISLNAPNDAVRSRIMPINQKWPIEEIFDAVRQVPLRPRERVTLEYVLLKGVTDLPEHAEQVGRLIRRSGLPLKVNLIVWNPGSEIPFQMPEPSAVDGFRKALVSAGVPVYLRKPRGRDIFAACGQLKRTVGVMQG